MSIAVRYVINLECVHDKIRKGEQFRVAHKFDISSGNDNEMLLTVGVNEIHLIYDIFADGDTKIDLYSGTTVSNSGTVITPLNYNLSSLNTATLSAYYSPTITTDGTLILSSYIFGGSGSNVQASHTTGQLGGAHLVLEPNTTYMVRFTNEAGQDLQIFAEFDYHEGCP